ncbi:hypothetical protein [Paenibacillus sp. LK1]|uniref:hypothetical protein n=1 Tax=Paenibacillus sp. LK1 TaxID=2053014 RepID=UPI000C18B344|nr:hypothetical protein [Paenibacillus sp. LK1]PIH59698.1 hypothetical protein CS562_07090 [Paenibacillus sp. LK1]
MNKLLILLNNIVLSTLELVIKYLPPFIHNTTILIIFTDSLVALAEKLLIVINKGSVEKEVEYGRERVL